MNTRRILAMVLALLLLRSANALAQQPDPSPAVYVAQITENSVVGVQSSTETWSHDAGLQTKVISQGSGVVVKDGGYILTNYHVIESCNSFKVLLPSGKYADAKLIGSDSSLDIAVLQADSDELVTCTIGSVSDLLVGSTVIAIGNPGGETLANTVTSGIVSALERNIDSGTAQRAVSYVQHDAAISSGNSGGGLFDYLGRLVGINTLKYAGSAYSSVSFEGLGFALPIDTVIPLVEEIIQYGKVLRPQLGVYTLDWDGPEDALPSYPPKSVLVSEVIANSSAEESNIQNYDFITQINGKKVACYRELTTILDTCKDGETVEVTLLRYNGIEDFLAYMYGGSNNPMGSMYGFGIYSAPTLKGFDEITVSVTLRILD